MAASEELSWPSAGSFVSAYKENLMAADTRNIRRVGGWGCTACPAIDIRELGVE